MKKNIFKALFILFIHNCFVQQAFSQAFIPDQEGYIDNSAFKALVKKKGYQLVCAFELINVKTKSYEANAILNNKLVVINNKGELVQKEKGPQFELNRPSGTSSDADIVMIASADSKNQVAPKYEQAYINGKFGTQNKVTKKPGLPAIYDGLVFQENGYVETKLNGKHGLALADGKILIEPQYEFISFSSAKKIKYYHVGKDGKQGVLDQNFKPVIPIVYDYLQSCYSCNESPNIYMVSKARKYGLVHINGTEILPLKYDEINFLMPGIIRTKVRKKFYGLVDSTGKVLADTIYSSIMQRPDADFITLKIESGRSKSGLMDFKGKVVLKPIYDEIGNFEHGIARITLKEKDGFIDKNGKLIVEPIYDRIIYQKPYFTVEKDGKYGVLDSNGKVIVPIEYDRIFPLDMVFYFEKGADKGLMTADKKIIKSIKYMVTPAYHSLIVKENEKYGVMDSSGKIIIPIIYDSFTKQSLFLKEGIAKAKKDGKPLMVDKYGNEYNEELLIRK